MSLLELQLSNVRCLASAELEFAPGLNLITGANGSGKTSLLEAVHLLGRGRSFRSRHTEQLIRQGSEQLLVFGRTQRSLPPIERHYRAGLQCSRRDGTVVQVDGKPVHSLVALTEVFPLQVIDPGIHRLVEEGPIQRRRWLDWAVFHVEPTFLTQWQQCTRALRQRNAALKALGDPTLWDGELIRAGEAVTAARAHTVQRFQPFWLEALRRLDAVPATLDFFAGWRADGSLAQALASHLERDRMRGMTSVGPQRADVRVYIHDRAVREVVSRGQQKVLGAAMTLAMTAMLRDLTGLTPTLLLDDPAAELDQAHTATLLEWVQEFGGQRIVTSLDPQAAGLGSPDRVFHVEHGTVHRSA